MPSWMTSAPRRAMWFMTRPIAFSLPGIDARREHHRVVRPELDVPVVVDRDARQRRHRLALRAGRQAQHVLRGVVRHVGVANLHAGGNAQVAEPLGDLASSRSCRGRRTPPCGRTAPPDPRGSASGRCSTRTPRRRAGPCALVKISSKASTTSVSEPVKPRRSTFVLSAKSASTPCGAELGEAVQVEVLAVERRLVDLEVAGVHDDADRRVDGQRHAVGHAVRDADELDRRTARRSRARAAAPRRSASRRSRPCSSSFGSTSASVSGVP